METLKKNLDVIKQYIENHDVDWVHVNTGGEGTGKSTLSAAIGFYFDRSFHAQRMAFSGQEFRRTSVDLDPLQCEVYDEGIENLYSRDAMKKENKRTIKFFRKCRYLQLLIQINIPNISEMDKALRPPSERVHSVARCTRQGRFHFYSQQSLKGIDYGDHTVRWPEPDFIGEFPNVREERPEFWETYEKKKEEDIKNLENGGEEKDGLSIKEMAKVVVQEGADPDTSDYIREYRGRVYVDKDLIAAEFEIGDRKSPKVKKLAEKQLGLG